MSDLYEYIIENFALDGTSQHLVASIFEGVSDYVTDDALIVPALVCMLAPVGIDEEEILRFI